MDTHLQCHTHTHGCSFISNTFILNCVIFKLVCVLFVNQISSAVTNGKLWFLSSFWEQNWADVISPLMLHFLLFFKQKKRKYCLINTDLIVLWRPNKRSSSLLTCFYSERLWNWRARLGFVFGSLFSSLFSKVSGQPECCNLFVHFSFFIWSDEVAGRILMGPSVLYCKHLTQTTPDLLTHVSNLKVFVFRVFLFKICSVLLI